MNDKAETLHAMGNEACITTLEQAIALQNTEKTILAWKEKLKKWKQELGKGSNNSL